MPEITLKYGLSNLISYSPANEMNRRENTIIAIVLMLIAEDTRGYTSAKYLSEHITDLGFKRQSRVFCHILNWRKALAFWSLPKTRAETIQNRKSKKEITLLASDYLPETFNLSAEMTAKQLSNGYLHCVTDDRWHAGNGI
ncbi:MAG: hypothetical protein ACLU9T_11875 [Blautia faecis]